MHFVIALFMLTSVVAAQDDFDRLERVPTEFVQRGRLLDKAQGFAMDAPRGWSWYRPRDEAGKYMALSPSGGEYFTVRSSFHYGQTITREDADLAFFDMGRRLAGYQGEVSNQLIREVNYPKPNSWYGTFSVATDTADSVAYFVYLVKGKRLYTIQAVTLDGFIPNAFKSFVMSLNVKPDILPLAEEDETTSDKLTATAKKVRPDKTIAHPQRKKGTFIVSAFLAMIGLAAGFIVWKRHQSNQKVGPSLTPEPKHTYLEELRQEVRKSPDNMLLWRSYWDRALEEGNKDDLALAGRRLLEETLKRDSTEGLYYWEQMVAQLGGNKLSLVLHNKMARLLLAKAQTEAAVKVLRTSVKNQDKQSFSQRMQTFELALTCDLELAGSLFDPLINSMEKTERDRQRLMEVQPKLKGQPEQSPFSKTAPSNPSKNLLVQEVGLTRLDASGLELLVAQETKRLPYHQIKSLAVGVLMKSERGQVLVFDLALDDVRQDLPRYRILRFTSTQLAITTLFPQASSPNEGYIMLARHILEQSGCLPLPSLASALGKYLRVNNEASWRAKMYP